MLFWPHLPVRLSLQRCRKTDRAARGWFTRLRCEGLETRHMMAAVSWIGGAQGSWDSASNWSDGVVPSATAEVSIDTTSRATITIGVGHKESIGSLVLGAADSLSISSSSLTIATSLTNSGRITVAAGCSLTVQGAYRANPGATLSLPGGGSPAAPASDLAINSDFEAPALATAPTLPEAWGHWGTVALSTQYAYTGIESVVMGGGNSAIYQKFSATPGAFYTVSVDAMMPAGDPLTGNETGQLALLFFDSAGAQISPYTKPNLINVLTSSSPTGGPLPGSVGNQGWYHFYTNAQAPANAATVEVIVGTHVQAGTGGGSVYWDDLEFGPSVAGPSTFTANSISNSGILTVGPTNVVNVAGAFSQAAAGTLNIQLGGSSSSGAFGLVAVNGPATLAGTLQADLVYGYQPSTSDTFTPIEFPSAAGTFAKYSLPSSSSYRFVGAVTFTNVVIDAAPAASVVATIDAGVKLHADSTNLLGINLTYWDGETTSQTTALVSAAQLAVYRFPGGSAADDFHFNVAANLNDSFAISISQFVQFIAQVGGKGMVTVDYGSASTQEAAAELAYLQGSVTDKTSIGSGLEWNDSTNQWQSVNWGTVSYWAGLRGAAPLAKDDGLNFMRLRHPAPYSNIQYWEIGNEEYGSWEIDHHGTPGPGGSSTGAQHDPVTYADFAAQFSQLAAEIDRTAGLPAISIGIDSDDPTGASDANWTQRVLAAGYQSGFVPAYISDHSYMQAPGAENDNFLLNQSDTNIHSLSNWSTRYADYEALLRQTIPQQAATVAVMATEYNSVYASPGKQSTSLVNGLFIAGSIGSLLESGYSGGFVWELRNGWSGSATGNESNLLYGWRKGGDYGQLGDPVVNDPPFTGANIGYPGYYALQLASKFVIAGGEVVSSTTNYGELSIYTVQEANGHLEFLVINTNAAANLNVQFNLTGFQPGGPLRIWQYGEPQDTAQSRSGTGASGLATATGSLALKGANFNYTFPAYSMTVLDLAPTATASAALASAQTVAALPAASTGQTLPAGGTTAPSLGATASPALTLDRAASTSSPGTSIVYAGSAPTGAVAAESALHLGPGGLTTQLVVPSSPRWRRTFGLAF